MKCLSCWGWPWCLGESIAACYPPQPQGFCPFPFGVPPFRWGWESDRAGTQLCTLCAVKVTPEELDDGLLISPEWHKLSLSFASWKETLKGHFLSYLCYKWQHPPVTGLSHAGDFAEHLEGPWAGPFPCRCQSRAAVASRGYSGSWAVPWAHTVMQGWPGPQDPAPSSSHWHIGNMSS